MNAECAYDKTILYSIFIIIIFIESNQVTLTLDNMTHIQVKGHKIPHLIGNCQYQESYSELWLQMGNYHCIQLQKSPKTWIKAEQFCQGQGQHLVAMHNELDEKLVQNLLLNR